MVRMIISSRRINQSDDLLFRLAGCLEKGQLQRNLREAEKQLRRSHEELEEKIHRRTLELQVKQQELMDSNTALRILLEQQKSRNEIEAAVSCNLKENVIPTRIFSRRKQRAAKEIYTPFLWRKISTTLHRPSVNSFPLSCPI